LRTNLISVASLENDGYECLFGNNKCTIKFNNVIIDLARWRGMLYMLSFNDFPVMNVCDVTNKRRRILTSDLGVKPAINENGGAPLENEQVGLEENEAPPANDHEEEPQ
jgi:hypothetical protein